MAKTKLKKRKQTPKEYVDEKFLNKGYSPVLNDDNTYSWVNDKGEMYNDPSEGGLSTDKQHELFGRRFDNAVSKYVMDYLKANPKDNWTPTEKTGTLAPRPTVDLAVEAPTKKLATTLPDKYGNNFILDEPEIDDDTTYMPFDAANTANSKLVEKQEKEQKAAEEAKKSATKNEDYLLYGVPMDKEFYRQWYLNNPLLHYKSDIGLDNWYNNLKNAKKEDIVLVSREANKLNKGTDAFLPTGDYTSGNGKLVGSLGFYTKALSDPAIRKQFNIGEGSDTWIQTISNFSKEDLLKLNRIVTAFNYKNKFAPPKDTNIDLPSTRYSGLGGFFKKGGKLVVKANNGTKYLVGKQNNFDYYVGQSGKFVKPLLDAANIAEQYHAINQLQAEKKLIPVRQHAFYQPNVKAIEGLPQEIIDSETNRINRIRSTTATSDAGVNLASNMGAAFERDSARERLAAKNAGVIQQNTKIHDAEIAKRDAMAQQVNEANLGEIYKKNVNDINADIWATQQKRQLAASVLGQLGINYVQRANFAYKNKLMERNTQLNNLISQRPYWQQRAANPADTTAQGRLDDINAEITKLIKGLPSFNTIANSGLTGKITD